MFLRKKPEGMWQKQGGGNFGFILFKAGNFGILPGKTP